MEQSQLVPREAKHGARGNVTKVRMSSTRPRSLYHTAAFVVKTECSLESAVRDMEQGGHANEKHKEESRTDSGLSLTRSGQRSAFDARHDEDRNLCAGIIERPQIADCVITVAVCPQELLKIQ